MRRRARPGAVRLVTAAIVVPLLTGCAQSAPDLSPAAATRLQADVLAVSRASAADDLPAARAALAALTKTLASTRDGRGLSAERQNVIEASIAAVAADLTALEAQRAAQAQAQAAADAAALKAAAEGRAAAGEEKNQGSGKHDKEENK